MLKHELIIIGAGPAGLAAAIEAVQHGTDVALIDENAALGGQYLCQPDTQAPLHYGMFERRPRIKQRLLQQFPAAKVALFQNTTVCGIEDHTVALLSPESKLERLAYDKLIIAPGAYDLPMPFPGWTLPGVISAGAALSLVKRQGTLPGERMVITGRGLILVALAAELIAAGGNVLSVLEASPGGSWWKTIGASLSKPDVALEGMGYWGRILRHRTRYRTSHIVTRALGNERLEEIVIQKVDAEWRPIAGTEERVPVDALCVGFGFVPSAQLFRLAGCEGKWRPESRAWLPVTDEHLRTSVEGIFAAGDGAAPEGVDIAEFEGRVAGLTAANELGRLATPLWERQVAAHQAKLAKLRQFRGLIDSLFRLGKETDALLSEDTLICRCEDVTWGELQAVLQEGARDLNTIKRWSRAGMGRCQGRNCEPTLAYLLQKHRNLDWAELNGFTCRFPVKPIPLSALGAADDQ